MRRDASRTNGGKREGCGDQNPAYEFGRTERQCEENDDGNRHSDDDDSPSQKERARDFSIRVCARAMSDGNNSHHAASIAGKAMLMISRMKKMAEMSAMGNILSCVLI